MRNQITEEYRILAIVAEPELQNLSLKLTRVLHKKHLRLLTDRLRHPHVRLRHGKAWVCEIADGIVHKAPCSGKGIKGIN